MILVRHAGLKPPLLPIHVQELPEDFDRYRIVKRKRDVVRALKSCIQGMKDGWKDFINELCERSTLFRETG
jgi:hypothetical protein